MPGVRPPLGHDPPRRLEHHGDRRLVVGPEDRAAGVPDDAVLDDRLERPGGRNRVEMGAEEDRRPLAAAPGQAAEDVPHRRADRRAGLVLVPLEPDVAELREHAVGDGPLLARRARDRAELEEEAEDVAQRAASTATAERALARSSAAPTKPRKSGAGRVGRDLNSGWNWLATNQG